MNTFENISRVDCNKFLNAFLNFTTDGNSIYTMYTGFTILEMKLLIFS